MPNYPATCPTVPTHRAPAPWMAPWKTSEPSNAECESGRGNCWGVYGDEDNACPQCDPVGYAAQITHYTHRTI